LTPFPIATAIIAAFTHAHEGPGAVVRFFRGFLPGLCTFAVFCAALSLALQQVTVVPAFAIAVAVQVALQGTVVWRMGRRELVDSGSHVHSYRVVEAAGKRRWPDAR